LLLLQKMKNVMRMKLHDNRSNIKNAMRMKLHDKLITEAIR
jgi:hypothetical protein